MLRRLDLSIDMESFGGRTVENARQRKSTEKREVYQLQISKVILRKLESVKRRLTTATVSA